MKKLARIRIFYFVFLTVSIFLLTACDNSEPTAVQLTESELQTVALRRSEVLVGNEWVIANMRNPDVHILELGRTAEEYASGHIEGAKFVDWRVDISDQSQPDKYNILPSEDFQQLMRSLGIDNDSTIVLYDSIDNRASTRMYWILKYYLHDSVKILEGGLSAWTSAELGLTDAYTYIAQSDYQLSEIKGTLLVDMHYLLNNPVSDDFHLVDGRPFAQYTGEAPGSVYHTGSEHIREGHIYGAQSVPWADNLNPDGSFKDYDELLALYEAHHVYRGGIVVTYCNEGLHAAMPWFVLSELLGYEDVRLYDSSMVEWANLSSTPMITGEHCM